MAAVPAHSRGVKEGFGVFEVEESSAAVPAAVRWASSPAAPRARRAYRRPSSMRSLIVMPLRGLTRFRISSMSANASARLVAGGTGAIIAAILPRSVIPIRSPTGPLDKFGELLLGFGQSYGTHGNPLSIHRPTSLNHLLRRPRRGRGRPFDKLRAGSRDSRQDAGATRT